MKPGIYHDITPEQYHGGPGVSSSGVKEALKSPAHYKLYCEQGSDWQPYFEEGHVLHDALLDPENIEHTYAWYDQTKSRNTKTYRTWREDNPGVIGLFESDLEMVSRVRERVAAHPILGGMFHGAKAEVSIYWEEDGLLLKCRTDYLVEFEDGFVIIDLKSSGKDCAASADQFRRTVAGFDYEVSAAMYKRGCEAMLDKPVLDFVFAVVEKSEPFNVGAFTLDEDYLELGRARLERGLDTIRQIEANPNLFDGYDDTIVTLSPPVWKMRAEGL